MNHTWAIHRYSAQRGRYMLSSRDDDLMLFHLFSKSPGPQVTLPKDVSKRRSTVERQLRIFQLSPRSQGQNAADDGPPFCRCARVKISNIQHNTTRTHICNSMIFYAMVDMYTFKICTLCCIIIYRCVNTAWMLFRRDQTIYADVMICPICSTPTIHKQECCIDAQLVSAKDLNGAKNKGSSNDFRFLRTVSEMREIP